MSSATLARPQTAAQKQNLLVEFSRVLIFMITLIVGVVSYLLQSHFINWAVLSPFYLILTFALGLHVVWVANLDWLHKNKNILYSSFVLDSALISALIYFSGVNQSIFLLLYLVNILLCGLYFHSEGALKLALWTSISFTLVLALSAEARYLNFLFILGLNNLAFFSVAGLTGYVSDQLKVVGLELQKAGLNVRSLEKLQKALFENSPVGIISFRSDGEILKWNESAQTILLSDESSRKNLFASFPTLRAFVFDGERQLKREWNIEAKTLSFQWSSFYSDILDENIYVAVVEDLTKVKELEAAVRQSEKLAAVGKLSAGIAHEIRNPLAGISGSVELLTQMSQNEDDKKLMKIILREIDRLNLLITDFLDYARPEKAPTDSVDLKALLSETVESLKFNQKLKQDVKRDVILPNDAFILGHQDKLKQVFLNFLINSYQALESTEGAWLRVEIKVDARHCTVVFEDNGCGMKPETLQHLFEPFHTTKAKGTGLGLAVSHKILESHKAKIQVSSTWEKGTRFELQFPRHRQGLT